jgi:hypothetical protein
VAGREDRELEEPKRLAPTMETARDLYLRSGNRCAYPGCNQPLMRSDGVLVGEIAHIEAAMEGGPRFRAGMTNEERRAFANLLLICRIHHTVIDTNLETWTVAKLQELKARHEAIYTGAVDRLRSTVGDLTEGTPWQPATNLRRLPFGFKLTDEEIASSLEVMNGFARRLAAVPVGARSVLALILNRGDLITSFSSWMSEAAIPWPLLQQIADCSEQELRDYIAVLEHAKLAWPHDPEDDTVSLIIVGNSTGETGWKIMLELKELSESESDSTLIRRVLVDLDFTAFDR